MWHFLAFFNFFDCDGIRYGQYSSGLTRRQTFTFIEPYLGHQIIDLVKWRYPKNIYSFPAALLKNVLF